MRRIDGGRTLQVFGPCDEYGDRLTGGVSRIDFIHKVPGVEEHCVLDYAEACMLRDELVSACAVIESNRASKGTDMWHSLIDKPESGKKIIATYGDGSGARLFMVTDAGPTPDGGTLLVDQDGDEYGELNADSYSLWAYLPDGFKLWFEIRSNDF